MGAVKLTISPPVDMARGKRVRGELVEIRNYWSRLAKVKGILSEKDRKRYLAE